MVDNRVPSLGDERTLLLRSDSPQNPPIITTHEETIQYEHNFQRRVTVNVALLTIIVEIPLIFLFTSETRIFEMIYCRQYYEQNDPSKVGRNGRVSEDLCKLNAIQSQVSTLRGGQQFFQNLPPLFLAIPLGIIADKYGRKWLLVLNAVSLLLRAVWVYVVCVFSATLDLKFVWLESLFVIMGGGLIVAVALIFTVLSDVTPDAEKATVFFRITAVGQICSAVGPFLAGALMKKDPWVTFTLAVGLFAFAIPATIFLPETLSVRHSAAANGQSHNSVSSNSSRSSNSDNFLNSDYVRDIKRIFLALRYKTLFLFRDWRIFLMCSVFSFYRATAPLDAQILQYVPQRLRVQISTSIFLQSMEGFISSVVLLFILPHLSMLLSNRWYKSLSSIRRDILFIRVGFLFYALGWLIIGLAPNLAVLVLGLGVTALVAGTGAAVRSVLTAWVRPDEIGRLYTVLGILETLGLMVGGPLVAKLYNTGLRTGIELWLGLPWIVLGVLMLGVFFVFCIANWTNSITISEESPVCPESESQSMDREI